jgi:sulfane dehydrogenase subunit SoxC
MTEPTDIGENPAVTSRRRFLREGSALVGGRGSGDISLAGEGRRSMMPDDPCYRGRRLDRVRNLLPHSRSPR